MQVLTNLHIFFCLPISCWDDSYPACVGVPENQTLCIAK